MIKGIGSLDEKHPFAGQLQYITLSEYGIPYAVDQTNCIFILEIRFSFFFFSFFITPSRLQNQIYLFLPVHSELMFVTLGDQSILKG